MSVPSATVDVISSGAAIVQGDPSKVIAVLGCSSKVPSGGSKKPYQYTKATDCLSDMGCGPGVKAAAQLAAKTGNPFIFLHIPATAVAAAIGTLDSSGKAGTSVVTATGTPTDGYEVIFLVTTGGTIGTSASFRYSLNGGDDYSGIIALSTATTYLIPGAGVTLHFAAGTLVATDTVVFSTTPASQTILPLTVTKANSSTSAITASGSPEDEYEVRLEILTGGTRGTAGIVYRYSLDGGGEFTPARQLGTAQSVDLDDGTEDSGVNVAFGAGTLDAGDHVVFKTTGPAWQASDVDEALANLKASSHRWAFPWIVGGGADVTGASVADVSSVGGVVSGWWGAGASAKFPPFVMEARDRTFGENVAPYSSWRARLVAAVATLDEYRLGYVGGRARITCPLTGRQNRRSAAWVVVPRVVANEIHIDPADRRLGALSSDVQIFNSTGHLVEEDAAANSALHDARYITLRTFPDEPGVFVARGNTMAALGADFSRIAHVRVIGQTATIQRREEQRYLEAPLPTNPPTVQAPLVAGALTTAFCNRAIREMTTTLQADMAGNAQGWIVNVDKSAAFLGIARFAVQVLPWVYCDSVIGTAQFANPLLLSLQTP